MKKLKYTLALIGLGILAACQKTELPEAGKQGAESAVVFSYAVPDYQELGTKAEGTVQTISLLQFDADGLFLGRSMASNLNGSTFKATVSSTTRILHFIANYDWSTFDERAALHKSEQELIPALETDTWAFWDRKPISDFSNPPTAELMRNQAKISVEISPELQAQIDGGKVFTVEGFAVHNYATRGTVAPFRPGAADPFQWSIDVPTLSANVTMPAGNTTPLNNNPKYLFESDNGYYNQTNVILYAGDATKKYYKIQLIDNDVEFYPVVRNTHFRIVIKDFIPGDVGAGSVDDALTGPPINNLYAEIIRESPSISDGTDKLTVNPLVHILANPGDGSATQRLEVPVEFLKNGVLSNGDVRAPKVILDEDNIISNLSFNAGTGLLTADVKVVASGQKTAEIRVTAGVLSRILTVISCEKYSFQPASIVGNTGKGGNRNISFTIPDNIPVSYFPLECIITAKHLAPTGSTKDRVIVESGDNESVRYRYFATGHGLQTLEFENSRTHTGELVAIENPIFHTAYLGEPVTLLSINKQHVPHLQGCVGFGVGQVAMIEFYVAPEVLAASGGGLNVTFEAPNLEPEQAGFGHDSPFFYYTVTKPGVQTVRFKVSAINQNHTENERMVKLYWNIPAYVGTSKLFYEYYLLNEVRVKKTCRRSNQGVNLSGSRDVYAYGPFVARNSGDGPSASGQITTQRDGAQREFYIIPNARLDHTVRLEIDGLDSSHRGRYTVRQLMGTLDHDDKLYFVSSFNSYTEEP